MDLGALSRSLAVKDIAASRGFYQNLGFVPTGGDAAQGWLILKGQNVVIGLFQGMLERNTLTFNPGWDGNAQALAAYTDVRALQRAAVSAGLGPGTRVDEAGAGAGAGHFTLTDPDGNPHRPACLGSREGSV